MVSVSINAEKPKSALSGFERSSPTSNNKIPGPGVKNVPVLSMVFLSVSWEEILPRGPEHIFGCPRVKSRSLTMIRISEGGALRFKCDLSAI